jgi:hypothetical protein
VRGDILPVSQYVFTVNYLITYRIRFHGVVLSEAQGLYLTLLLIKGGKG